MTDALSSAGHVVQHAPTVVGGLRQLHSSHTDLLITNTSVQRQHDGIKIIDLILLEKKLKVAPMVMVLTQDQDPALIKHCVQAGVADYVLWSGDAAAVLPRVEKALSGVGALGEQLVSEVATYLGPAARIVIEKGSKVHLKIPSLEALRSEHLPELFRWLRAMVTPVLKDRVSGFLERLETRFRIKRRRD